MSAEPHATEDSAMSEAVPGADADGPTETPSNAQLAERLDLMEEKLQAKEERIEELEEQLEQQPEMKWESESPKTIKIVHPESGFEYPLGSAAAANLPSGWEESDLDDLEDDVEKLKRGEVDATDVVAAFDPEIPIEEDVAKAQDDVMRSDLTANEKRAVKVFRAFGGRSRRASGTLKIVSGDVRNILEEKGEKDPNPNTVKRTMKMLAKKTSDLPKGDRDAFHDGNLLTLHKGNGCLELRADRSEWNAYTQEVQDRVEK